jgi:hypothetical protein
MVQKYCLLTAVAAFQQLEKHGKSDSGSLGFAEGLGGYVIYH